MHQKSWSSPTDTTDVMDSLGMNVSSLVSEDGTSEMLWVRLLKLIRTHGEILIYQFQRGFFVNSVT